MKNASILLLALLFLSTGVVKSQAPVTPAGVTLSLQALITANKALLDKQRKTLDALDQLDQNAQQLKIFGKRS